jgi:AbrB family looped-hinge helix DNA binding protein
MEKISIPADFQVVIPRSAREQFGLEPGDELVVRSHEDWIELIPLRPACDPRGLFRGMRTDVIREPDRF